MLRLLLCLVLALPTFAGELEDAKKDFAKHDAEMKAVLTDLKKCLRARQLLMVEESQEHWWEARDGISNFQARDQDPETSVEKWQTAAWLTANRVAWLKAWKKIDERKGWAGDYMDAHGGSLQILEKDGKTYFYLEVVRGPTFHNGQIGGELKIDGNKASFETRAFEDSELTKIMLSPLGDGSGRLKLDAENTSYFHGARASFQGNYLWTGELDAKQKKLFEKQYKENFGE